MRTLLCLALTTVSAQPNPLATVLDLGSATGDWLVSNKTMHPVAATVPGQIHTDLLAAGVIGEPYNGSNPDLQKWVAYSNWTYTRQFTVPLVFLQSRVVQLISLGVDTIADIYINDKKVVHTDNMFHRCVGV